jgi:hypothetical protein
MKKITLIFRNTLLLFTLQIFLYYVWHNGQTHLQFSELSIEYIVYSIILYTYVITNTIYKSNSTVRTHSTVIIPKGYTEY